MTAPGDQLEFEKAPQFIRVEKSVPGLAAAVKERYSHYPNSLVTCSAHLKKGDVIFGGRTFEFLVRRKGATRIYLLAVAEVKNGGGISKADMSHYVQLFG